MRAFETGQKLTHMVTITPDGRRLYTGNIGSGSSTAIDLELGEVLVNIPTGGGCEGLDAAPDGRHVWTANRAVDTLAVVQVAGNGGAVAGAVDTLPCRGFPIRVKLTPDGRLALVSCATADQLSVWDAETRQEVQRVDVGPSPIGLLVEPSGRRAFVAVTEANEIAVVDLKTMGIVGRVATGKTPDGLGWARG